MEWNSNPAGYWTGCSIASYNRKLQVLSLVGVHTGGKWSKFLSVPLFKNQWKHVLREGGKRKEEGREWQRIQSWYAMLDMMVTKHTGDDPGRDENYLDRAPQAGEGHHRVEAMVEHRGCGRCLVCLRRPLCRKWNQKRNGDPDLRAPGHFKTTSLWVKGEITISQQRDTVLIRFL